MLSIRAASSEDHPALWRVLEPVIRAGETYALPPDWSEQAALLFWCAPSHQVFVAEMDGEIVGTYFLRANYGGGGSHVANCGYVTADGAVGSGVGRAMCEHSLEQARRCGFRAMQFNFVVSSNTRAVALWHRCGFETVGRLPSAFQHPSLGYVDALVMHRML